MFTRRFLTCIMSSVVPAATLLAADENAAPRKEPVWRLSVQTYTFNRFTFFEAVDKARSLGLRDVEGFGWQKISADHGDAQLNPAAGPEALEAVRKKLKDAGIRLAAYYVHEIGKDEAETRRLFDFARDMGIEIFVGEPEPAWLPLLDKLTQEYNIKVAIHNHPRKPGDDKYVHWHPARVMQMVEKHNPRIGFCADTGHWMRSEIDPIKGLRTYDERLISLHLKDVSEKGPGGKDVPFGEGVGDVRAMLKELQRQRFSGLISIEYESNMEDNYADVEKCLNFIRQTARELGQKVE
jgi:sugar phosphate isomerase/epimerase